MKARLYRPVQGRYFGFKLKYRENYPRFISVQRYRRRRQKFIRENLSVWLSIEHTSYGYTSIRRRYDTDLIVLTVSNGRSRNDTTIKRYGYLNVYEPYTKLMFLRHL